MSEICKFEAVDVTETEIILKESSAIVELVDVINQETDFILEWKNSSGAKVAKLIIATNIVGKIRNGEITISAKN